LCTFGAPQLRRAPLGWAPATATSLVVR